MPDFHFHTQISAAAADSGLVRSFHLSLLFVSPLSWEPFHPLLLINSLKSSRMREVSLGEEAALWRKEVLDYYQQKTCRENSCSRVIGAVTSRHCRRNQPKVEKNESKKNLFISQGCHQLSGTHRWIFLFPFLPKDPWGAGFRLHQAQYKRMISSAKNLQYKQTR